MFLELLPNKPRAPPVPRVPPQTTQTLPKQTAPSAISKPSAQSLSVMVVHVQAALMRLGYFNGDIDGVLGPQTRAAIVDYQKAQRLKQTGRLDIDTLTKLGISIP